MTSVVAEPSPPAATGTEPPGPVRTRGRRQSSLWRLRGDISPGLRAAMIAVGLATPLVAWVVFASSSSESFLVPSPGDTWAAGVELYRSGDLWIDFLASLRRVVIGYSISVTIGVVLGLLIGSFRSAEAYFEPQIGFLRYIPATALLPLFLFWLGIDETPKVALIVAGTVFYNVLMVADVVRNVPRELIFASYTLGAGRRTVLRRVIFPHSLPGMIDVARINLAAGWLMLVVAELLAAEEGLAFRIVRAQRFRQVDRMFALLIVFGLIGVVSDMALRWLRDRSSPWARA